MPKHKYTFERYCSPKRWDTYYQQIKYCRECGAKLNVLVIGPGDYIVPLILTEMGYHVETFGIEETADYVGDLRDIENIIKKDYDVIICCEVLEHIELDKAIEVIKYLKTRAQKRIIISVPILTYSVDKYHKWELGHGIDEEGFTQFFHNPIVKIVGNKFFFVIENK